MPKRAPKPPAKAEVFPPFFPGWGARLRRLRERAHLTQDKFAEECGVAQGTVSRHEQETVPPEWPTLYSYCGVLGVPVEAILFGDTSEENPHADLIESYLEGPFGKSLLTGPNRRPEVVERLRKVRFAEFGLRVVTLEAVHDVRLFLERHTPVRR